MEHLNLKKQEHSYLKLNRVILSVVFIIITIIVTTATLIKGIYILYIVAAIGIIWTIFTLIFLYQTAAFKHFSYAMNEYGLYINRGVFWRRKIIVPKNRVQHTDVSQGPLERRHGLSELIVHTAGTRNASVKLPGILQMNAENLRESLSFEESNDAV